MLKSQADSSRILVFTGPSLNPSKAAELLDATYLPPIKRGDLLPLLTDRPRIVAIVDGEFFQSLAVGPKEVLALLESGIRVYGASSMGALRAVELRHYGMVGVGAVFRLFRRGVLDSDDEVAMVYCPATYRAISEPLVNTRCTLRAAVRQNILTTAEAGVIISELKSAYFPERTRAMFLLIARKLLGMRRAEILAHFFAGQSSNIKERDAKLLLSRIRRDLETSEL